MYLINNYLLRITFLAVTLLYSGFVSAQKVGGFYLSASKTYGPPGSAWNDASKSFAEPVKIFIPNEIPVLEGNTSTSTNGKVTFSFLDENNTWQQVIYVGGYPAGVNSPVDPYNNVNLSLSNKFSFGTSTVSGLKAGSVVTVKEVKLQVNQGDAKEPGKRTNVSVFVQTYNENISFWQHDEFGEHITETNVGIGVAKPLQKLHIDGNILLEPKYQDVTPVVVSVAAKKITREPGYHYFEGQDLAIRAGDADLYGNSVEALRGGSLYLESGKGYNTNGGAIFLNPAKGLYGGYGTVVVGGKMVVNGPIEATSFNFTGNLGIGTSNPTEKLHVVGNVKVVGKLAAKEVCVNSDAKWCDYVFEKDYRLMPLNELNTFIEANKHLPEIPSAKEVEKNGYSLSEINTLFLKKIEELTLYVIEQDRKIEALEKKISAK